jgi:hypothetical protein
MKKLTVGSFLIMAVLIQFCSPAKKAQNQQPKINYEANVQPLIVANCSPCHIPPKGNKEPLNTYAAAKENIDDAISRIKLNPGDKGFMPFKHSKLSDSTIRIFEQWKADGLLEK